MGPTASGKTDLAERLADATGAQLISADAFQVYRGFDIGTAKTLSPEKYLLVDIRDPDEGFGVGEFVLLASEALASLWNEGRSAIVVGGTGLYIRALFEEYAGMSSLPDPDLRLELDRRIREEGLPRVAAELSERFPERTEGLDLGNPARVRRAYEKALDPGPPIRFEVPPYLKVKVVLDRPIDQLVRRIDDRLEDMIGDGWVEEVQGLREQGVRFDDPAMRGIGYRILWQVLEGEGSLDQAKVTIGAEMRQYAKRQRTWLRREPRAEWLPCGESLPYEAVLRTVGGRRG